MSRRDRALVIARGRALVSADPATVAWLTGLVMEIEWGPSPFSAPPLVVLQPDGSIVAVVSEDEAPGLAADVDALTFPGFVVADVDRTAVAHRLALSVVGSGELAVELASLPGSFVQALGGRTLHDVAAELRNARAVKDPDELDAIRTAAAVADAGQAVARAALRAGVSELELWSETRAAMEAAAGGRIPVLADFVTGARTAEVGGPPGKRRIAEGELLLVDLVPRVGAYWADSCATVALGEAPAAARRAHAAAVDALDAAKEAVRPGARAADIDAAARSIGERAGLPYPHHTGHGVGLTIHEEPRIIPGTDRVLESGMVVALEPGAYGDGWGVRVEQLIVVTQNGCDVLSQHDISL